MTYSEIIAELKLQKEYLEINDEDISRLSGYHKNTVGRVLRGDDCRASTFVDVINSLGLDITVRVCK